MNMSKNPTQPTKTSRRQRVLAHFTFKGRASSSLSSPSSESRSNQTATSSSAQITNASFTQDASSSATSAVSVSADLSIASIGLLSSSQTTSTSSFNSKLLRDVLKRLSSDDRAIIQDCMFHNVSDIDLTFEQVLAATKKKQRYCIEKRWKFTFRGRTVDVKEETDKVIGWLDRFKAIEDIVINVDPMHVGLSWAGIRLLLEIKPHAPE